MRFSVPTLAESFDPRVNSIGFLRWLMALMVIFSHAGPLAGFYAGHDLGSQINNAPGLGTVAVSGFFFLSGYLITKSRVRSSSTISYFWRRALRIFPAFWLTLLLTAFVIAPLAWVAEHQTLEGYFSAQKDNPLTYLLNNMFLQRGQLNIADMGKNIPFGLEGGADWNGASWSIGPEFLAYIFIGTLALCGFLVKRKIAAVIGIFIIFLNSAQWFGLITIPVPTPKLYVLLAVIAVYNVGMLFALFDDKIRINGFIALVALVLAFVFYATNSWYAAGEYFWGYFLMWFATRVKSLHKWEKYGDFSYGIYIFGWPVMQLGAFYGLQNAGWLVYHAVIIVLVHVLGFISWHTIEKPAMSLKDLLKSKERVGASKTRMANIRYAPLVVLSVVTVVVAGVGVIAKMLH